jgi:hypothetical protein
MLAQLYMRKEDFKTARQFIDKLSGDNIETEMRQRAQRLLTQLVSLEEHEARVRKEQERAASEPRNSSEFRDSHDPTGQQVIVREVDPAAILRESLRKPAAGETQAQGTLASISCDAKGITFIVKDKGRLFKLHTDNFERMDILSFSEDAGSQVTCGPRKPENNVIVCYLPATDPRAKIDGVIKSIEFVPPDFKLKP